LSEDSSPANDFDTAKGIVEKLASLSRERQERILRWVSESCGLAIAGQVPIASGPPSPIIPVVQAPGTRTSGGAKDIKAFIAEKAPKSDQQFAAAVAYYYRFEAPAASRRESIDGGVLQEAARLAGWRRPKRPTDTLHNARKAGYLDSAARGTFTLNNVGENLVAMAMPAGNASGKASKAKGRKRSTARKAKAAKMAKAAKKPKAAKKVKSKVR
jgi:hypothetical protein